MADALFTIGYDGIALDTHEMEVRQLSPALHAIGDLFEAANRVLNGSDSQVSIRVKGSFKTGSFQIDLVVVQKLLQSCISILTGKEIDAGLKLAQLIGILSGTSVSLIAFIKWLGKRTIEKVIILDQETAEVRTADDSIVVQRKVLSIYQDMEVRTALDAVIYQPLLMDGIDKFYSGSNDKLDVVITETESAYFITPPAPIQDMGETVSSRVLQLVNIAFQDDNKWRFTDGVATFYASITDESFLRRIDAFEISFTKGDSLRVELRCKQWKNEKGTIKADYIVEKVLEHISQAVQIKLPF